MKQYPFLLTLTIVVGALIILFCLIYWVILPWSDRWGASQEETARSLPGDGLVTAPATQVTHAITIQAPPDKVWAWLIQLGVNRGGMYSYDALENLLGLKVHSTREIRPEWQALAAGDFIRFTPVDYFIHPGPGAYVVSMQPYQNLVACFAMENQFPDPCTSSWQFILQELPGGTTRLIIRTRTLAAPGFSGQAGRLFALVSFTMERKMMLGIRERAQAWP